MTSPRADTARQIAAAITSEVADPLGRVAAELEAAYAPLPALLESLQEADAKPTPLVEAAANDAVRQATAVLARVPG